MSKFGIFLTTLILIAMGLMIIIVYASLNTEDNRYVPTITPGGNTSAEVTPSPDSGNGHKNNDIIIDDNNYVDDSLTARQKADMINLTLNDAMVKEIMSKPNATYRLGNVSPAVFDSRFGYLGIGPGLVNVPITIGMEGVNEQVFGTINNITHPFSRVMFNRLLVASIDPDSNRIMSLVNYEDANQVPSSNFIMIPPGSYYQYEPSTSRVILPYGTGWYHVLNSWTNWQPKYEITLTLEPEDARVYPIILDRTNFEKFMSGNSYEVLEYIDPMTNMTYRYDGNSPVASGWSTRINMGNESAYIILKNIDDRETKVNIRF